MKFISSIIISICGILFPLFSFSQITLTLPSIETCPGNIEIPVQTQNFNDVASVSMKIKYDTTILFYDTFTELNPAFNSGLFLLNAIHDQVIFSWFALNPVNLGNTNLLTLQFHHLLNANTTVEWYDDSLGNCVLTDLNGTELNTILVDAIITTSFHKPIPISPENNAEEIGLIPIFHWNGSGCGPHYVLMYSTDSNFINSTSISNIFGTNLIPDSLEPDTTYWWKVQAIINSTPYYTDWSEVFTFKTKPINGISELHEILSNFNLSPNPAKDQCKLSFDVKEISTINIQLTNIAGEIIQQITEERTRPGTYIRVIDICSLTPGVYFVTMLADTSFQRSIKSAKLIILR